MAVIVVVVVVVSGEAFFAIARDSQLVRLPDPWKRDNYVTLWLFVYLVLLVLVEPPHLAPQNFQSFPRASGSLKEAVVTKIQFYPPDVLV